METLNNKPLIIQGLNGIFVGKIMSTDNYHNQNYDFMTSYDSDINIIIAELEKYISSKLQEISKKEEERKLFVLTENGKKEEKIKSFLTHTKRDFHDIEVIIGSFNYDMMFEFYGNDNDYTIDTGAGDPIWNKRAEKELEKFLEKSKKELTIIENNLKIKFNENIETLFYWDLPLCGNIPSDIDYHNEHNLRKSKTISFILNCEFNN
jgi:hypothetical protein